MPTVLTHGVIAVAASKTFLGKRTARRVLLMAVICSVLPDIDTIGLRLGIPYADFLGHRGFTHSLVFAAIVSFSVAAVGFRSARVFSLRWLGVWVLLFVVAASHGVLDAMTNGGLGIALLAPFDQTRYFLPFRPLEVSPIGLGNFFSRWGAAVLASEIIWVWTPLGLLWATARGIRAIIPTRRGTRAVGADDKEAD